MWLGINVKCRYSTTAVGSCRILSNSLMGYELRLVQFVPVYHLTDSNRKTILIEKNVSWIKVSNLDRINFPQVRLSAIVIRLDSFELDIGLFSRPDSSVLFCSVQYFVRESYSGAKSWHAITSAAFLSRISMDYAVDGFRNNSFLRITIVCSFSQWKPSVSTNNVAPYPSCFLFL